MTGFAFVLVFVAALIHAVWNLLAKRSNGGISFIFLINVFAALIYAPIVLIALHFQSLRFQSLHFQQPPLNAVTFSFILGSATIHFFYFLILQRGYRAGDLSLVYPLARGTGPLLSTAAAIAFLGERPTLLAITGIGLILGGVVMLTGNLHQIWRSGARAAIAYGLLTGVLIACYTIWDKYAVSQFQVSPVLLNYGSNLVQSVLLAPLALGCFSLRPLSLRFFARQRWHQVRSEWCAHRLEILGVAVLSPLAYILVLIAMVFTPVSHVAPIRELSILLGTVMGNRLLAEGEVTQRLFASGVIVLGIATLAAN